METALFMSGWTTGTRFSIWAAMLHDINSQIRPFHCNVKPLTLLKTLKNSSTRNKRPTLFVAYWTTLIVKRVVPGVSKHHSAFIFRVKQSKKNTCSLPWRQRHYDLAVWNPVAFSTTKSKLLFWLSRHNSIDKQIPSVYYKLLSV